MAFAMALKSAVRCATGFPARSARTDKPEPTALRRVLTPKQHGAEGRWLLIGLFLMVGLLCQVGVTFICSQHFVIAVPWVLRAISVVGEVKFADEVAQTQKRTFAN